MKLAWVVLVLLATPALAGAHPVGFGVLQLRERPGSTWDVELRVSGGATRALAVEAVLPSTCEPITPIVADHGPTGVDRRWRVRCDLIGTVGVEGVPSDVQVQLRIDPQQGPPTRVLLDARHPTHEVGAATSVFSDYVELGTRHILSGFDHLLFILGLVALLWGRRRSLVVAVTSFTAGHSVTLTLATFGYVRVGSAGAEAVIALSLVLLAVELTRRGDTLSRRHPWSVAGGFGLVHGLGFAGALQEIGVPAGDVPQALFAFNIGVELGQLAVVAGLVGLGMVASRTKLRRAGRPQKIAAAIVPYMVGIAGCYWLSARLVTMATGF